MSNQVFILMFSDVYDPQTLGQPDIHLFASAEAMFDWCERELDVATENWVREVERDGEAITRGGVTISIRRQRVIQIRRSLTGIIDRNGIDPNRLHGRRAESHLNLPDEHDPADPR